MEYRPLGQTDVRISVIGLGTMTFGEQNSEAEAHDQLDYALSRGVNFIDTAELYAIPPHQRTYGRTEEIIGRWLKTRRRRKDIILASKIAGPGDWVPHIRGGKTRFDPKTIQQALDDSLRRLQTDTIDLYQLHWPERQSNFFGRLGYVHQPQSDLTPMEETLQALEDQVRSGKIRFIGLSNETPWGVMTFLQIAQRLGLSRIVSIQNPYSLLNRTFEIGLAEIAEREKVGLVAYSPLGFGVLSGKYLAGAAAPHARLTLFPHYDRYSNPQALAATAEYVSLAQEHGMTPAQMALAYVRSRSFLTSTLIGATRREQLQENIDSVDISLPPEVIERIEAVHACHPNPAP